MGIWKKENSLYIDDPDIWSRRALLDGHHFAVVSAYSPPAVTYIRDNCPAKKSKECFQGLHADILRALADKMNFTYTVQRVYQWGSLVNGTWVGMVGMVKRKEADIAVADLIVSSLRSTAVDFLSVIEHHGIDLYIKTPGDALSFDGYISPLTAHAWAGVLLVLLIIPLILAGMIRLGREMYAQELNLCQCYCFFARSLIMNSTSMMPSTGYNRIAFGSALFGGIAIYYLWEAMLISYLAVKKTELPFQTLNELAEMPKYKLVVGAGTEHFDRFKYSNNSLYQKLWKEKIEPYADNLPSYTDLAKVVNNEPYTVAYSEDGARYDEAYSSCKIIDTGVTVSSSKLAWAVEKNSPFYDALNYNIKSLQEIGVIQRNDKTYKPHDQVCPDLSGKPLAMNQCISAFLILIGGFLICALVFGLEYYISFMSVKRHTHFSWNRKKKSVKASKIGNSESDNMANKDFDDLRAAYLKLENKFSTTITELRKYNSELMEEITFLRKSKV